MGIHWTELIIVLAMALLFFGPRRLPEMGSAIGKTYREFKKALSEGVEPSPIEPSAPAPLTASAATTPAAPTFHETPRA